MTVDAVGGVWRYAMDLGRGLADHGYDILFAGLGPLPSALHRLEAEAVGELVWLDAALDWTAGDERELDQVPRLLEELVARRRVDLLHLNLPTQADGLQVDVPVVAVSHSCVVSWFRAVRGSEVPADWLWHFRRNRSGLMAADAVVAPSHSHAALLRGCYGPIPHLTVIENASSTEPEPAKKEKFVFAAGRWWDDGKNGTTLDQAAALTRLPIRMAGPQTGPNGQHTRLIHAEMLGERPHGEIRSQMARAMIVASPSIYEPFGLAALEGAQAGAALVLADIPTYRELWEGAALFADPHSPEAFADAIDRLDADPALHARMVRRSLARASRFSVQRQVEAVVNLYNGLTVPAHEPALIAG